jgi:hypothetical protein
VPALQALREDFRVGRRNDFCFNAFCLMRIRMVSLPESGFDTLESMLVR